MTVTTVFSSKGEALSYSSKHRKAPVVEWINAAERLPKLGSESPFFKSYRVLIAAGRDSFVKIGRLWVDSEWVGDDGFVIPNVVFWAEFPHVFVGSGEKETEK